MHPSKKVPQKTEPPIKTVYSSNYVHKPTVNKPTYEANDPVIGRTGKPAKTHSAPTRPAKTSVDQFTVVEESSTEEFSSDPNEDEVTPNTRRLVQVCNKEKVNRLGCAL